MARRHLILGLVFTIIGLTGLIVSCYLFSRIISGQRYPFTKKLSDKKAEEGRKIYYTGRNIKGERISYFMPRRFYMHRRSPGPGPFMHGGGLGCVQCHRRSGKGGLKFPDDSKTSDIRWKSLEKHKFDFKTFKRAVTEGIDEDGEELSSFMPRWDMTDSELKSLQKYLKTLK